MKKNIKKNVYLFIPEPLCHTAEPGKHYKSAILKDGVLKTSYNTTGKEHHNFFRNNSERN